MDRDQKFQSDFKIEYLACLLIKSGSGLTSTADVTSAPMPKTSNLLRTHVNIPLMLSGAMVLLVSDLSFF